VDGAAVELNTGAPSPTPVNPLDIIPPTGSTVLPDNTVCVFPPAISISQISTPVTAISIQAPLPAIIQPPWQDPAVNSTTLPQPEARYGWYPIEAFAPYTVRSPYLVWSLPPQPRPTVEEQQSAVKKGWYPSEVYGQAPGGLVYGYPPNPNQSYTNIDTTNNTPVNAATPNVTTTTDTTKECATAIDIVGDLVKDPVRANINSTISCISPEKFIIPEINPQKINHECWPGEVIDDTFVSDVIYTDPDSGEIGQNTAKRDYFNEYENTTIYTKADAQVSFAEFDEEYMGPVNAQ